MNHQENVFVEVMLTIRACERRGIKTVLVTYRYSSKDGVDSPLFAILPEADAVVDGEQGPLVGIARGSNSDRSVLGMKILSYPGAPMTDAPPISLVLNVRNDRRRRQ